MAQRGVGAGYVYSELQEVAATDGPDDPIVGCIVVAIRMDLGSDKPSQVLVLDVAQATSLYNDLGRILEEYATEFRE